MTYRETLKSLSEGGASLDELASKREELMNELQEHHKVNYQLNVWAVSENYYHRVNIQSVGQW